MRIKEINVIASLIFCLRMSRTSFDEEKKLSLISYYLDNVWYTQEAQRKLYLRGENEKGIRRPILRRFSCQYVKTSINYERHRFYYILF